MTAYLITHPKGEVLKLSSILPGALYPTFPQHTDLPNIFLLTSSPNADLLAPFDQPLLHIPTFFYHTTPVKL